MFCTCVVYPFPIIFCRCSISIFAVTLAYIVDTSEEEALPMWISAGLWAIVSTQLFFIPYSAWPLLSMAKLFIKENGMGH